MAALCATARLRRVHLYFRLHPEKSVRASDCVNFFRQLEQNIHTPIIVMWDRLRAHRSKAVEKYLGEHPRIDCEYFPSYAPELNPMEFGWSYLKTKPLAGFAPKNLEELNRRTKSSLCEVRHSHELLKSFLAHSHLFDGGPSGRRRQ